MVDLVLVAKRRNSPIWGIRMYVSEFGIGFKQEFIIFFVRQLIIFTRGECQCKKIDKRLLSSTEQLVLYLVALYIYLSTVCAYFYFVDPILGYFFVYSFSRNFSS